MAEMRNITELDLELAGLFYPILIELAKNDAPLIPRCGEDDSGWGFPRR